MRSSPLFLLAVLATGLLAGSAAGPPRAEAVLPALNEESAFETGRNGDSRDAPQAAQPSTEVLAVNAHCTPDLSVEGSAVMRNNGDEADVTALTVVLMQQLPSSSDFEPVQTLVFDFIPVAPGETVEIEFGFLSPTIDPTASLLLVEANGVRSQSFPPCRPVGGIAELPDVAGASPETGSSAGSGVGVLVGVVTFTAAVFVLGSGAWWVGRRGLR